MTSILLGSLALAGAVYFLAPLLIGVCHLGMFWPAALLLALAARCFFPGFFRRWPRWLRRTARICLAIGLSAAAAVLVWMAAAALDRPAPDEAPRTVIVLGCRVYGGQPSLMLRRRIEAAYDYLAAHPDAVCVPTGGLDGGETVTEGGCIANALMEMGIDPSRIFPEEYAFDTRENLQFSAEIIAREGLDTRVVIVSDNFHLLRGRLFARQCGLSAKSYGCVSPWYLGAGYWCREVAGVPATLVGLA